MLKKIISGGQTGVDRAALDIALKYQINYGGWCPKGRLDENGIIPARYAFLQEIEYSGPSQQENYDKRTLANIKDSDGTLILVPTIPLPSSIQDGTLLTIKAVEQQTKPFLVIDISGDEAVRKIMEWLDNYKISVINIAGPRESTSPGIYQQSYEFLEKFFCLFEEKRRQEKSPCLFTI